MKKNIVLVLVMLALVATVALVGCVAKFNPDAPITVVSREDGSGTRAGFDDIVGLKGENKLVGSATINRSTGEVMTKVNTSPTAIGYISLGSLNDTVKAVKIGGVAVTVANVKDESYKLQRSFNIVTKEGVTMSAQSEDFIKYIMSSKGQDIAIKAGYVSVGNGAEYVSAKNTVTGSLNISGSSSVSPLMMKIKDAYEKEQSGVKITLVSTDSGAGISDVNNSKEAASHTIGMISRDKKSSESGIISTKIAIDGIAVVVNNLNTVSDLTITQLLEIYSGKITRFSEVIK